MKPDFKQGVKDGLPVGIGYLSVSFAFGMMVQQGGYSPWIALFISMTNVTSAGQFAGFNLMMQMAPYIEIAMTTLIINLRYALMSLSLSQKFDEKMHRVQRAICAYGVTDEIFAIAMQRPTSVSMSYFMGLFSLPYLGWATGTFLGAWFSGLLPDSIASCMNIALYAMFIAIILPQAKEEKNKRMAILLAVILSCIFAYIPILKSLSSGWVIIGITVAVSLFMAIKYPIVEEGDVCNK